MSIMSYVNGFGVIDSKMLSFVCTTISASDTHATELATRFSFRNRFHHCVRVALLAMEIAESEGATADVASVSGLFHDSGKAEGCNHGVVSAEICRTYLEENQLLVREIDHIVVCVRNHSARIDIGDSPYSNDLAILRDADLLDEVGAMGITWTLLGTGMLEPKSYNEALTRLIELHTKDPPKDQLSRMHTTTARCLMQQRIKREQRFIRELSAELKLDQFDPEDGAT